MSKITIKRFLNKKVKARQIVYSDLDELGYPLYYSITYQRKTQHIKSFTGAVMTEKAFLYLEENSKPLDFETNYNEIHHSLKLNNEKELIYNAVKFITETENLKDIFDEEFTPRLKEYFEPLDEKLYFLGWNNQKHSIDLLEPGDGKELSVKEFLSKQFPPTENEIKVESNYKNIPADIEFFYNLFNKKQDLISIIKKFNDITNIDLTKYFYEGTLKNWYVINLILIAFPNSVTIEFITDYNAENLILLNKKIKFPVTNKEINSISNKLRMNLLGKYYK